MLQGYHEVWYASGRTRADAYCCAQNKLHINDWNSITGLFDKLNKQLEKTQKVTEATAVPRMYLKLLVELEVGSDVHVCCRLISTL